MNEIYKQAKFWHTLGIAVIPVFYKSKQPKLRWFDYTTSLPGENDLARWFAGRYVNAAVITGWEHLCILDFDDMEAFNRWKDWAVVAQYGKTAHKVLQQARMSFSGRGVHIYTFCPDAINLKLPGIDILAVRKYALIPPSMHPSGKRYSLGRDAMPAAVPSIMDLFPADQIEPVMEQALTSAASTTTERQPLTASVSSGPYDPWDSAGVDYRFAGEGIITAIKLKYRIESFFPDAFKSGAGYMLARCPFHNDRSPSLSINVEQQTCKCLAGHGCTPKPLDVIGVYAKLHNLTNEQAITEMAKGL